MLFHHNCGPIPNPHWPATIIDSNGQLHIEQITPVDSNESHPYKCNKISVSYVRAHSSIPLLSNVESLDEMMVFLSQDGRIGSGNINHDQHHYYQLPKIIQLLNHVRKNSNSEYCVDVLDVNDDVHIINLTTHRIGLRRSGVISIITFGCVTLYQLRDGTYVSGYPLSDESNIGSIVKSMSESIINSNNEVVLGPADSDDKLVRFSALGIVDVDSYADNCRVIRDDGTIQTYDLDQRNPGQIKKIRDVELSIDIKPVRFVQLSLDSVAIEDDKGDLYLYITRFDLKYLYLTKFDFSGRLIQQC